MKTLKVIYAIGVPEFEKALNDAAALGFQLTTYQMTFPTQAQSPHFSAVMYKNPGPTNG